MKKLQKFPATSVRFRVYRAFHNLLYWGRASNLKFTRLQRQEACEEGLKLFELLLPLDSLAEKACTLLEYLPLQEEGLLRAAEIALVNRSFPLARKTLARLSGHNRAQTLLQACLSAGLRDWPQAWVDFQAASELEPKDPGPRLGMLYSLSGAAESLARRAKPPGTALAALEDLLELGENLFF